MSVHAVPETVSAADLAAFCAAHLRAPVNVTADPDTGAAALHFDPDLSAAEADLFAAAVGIVRARLTGITPAEFIVLRPDLAGLRDYHALSSPTNAQSVLAIKAIIRVLGAILRDPP